MSKQKNNWEDYNDSFVLLLRPTSPVVSNEFEYVVARPAHDIDSANISGYAVFHGVLFTGEYVWGVAKKLGDAVLKNCGFDGIEDFVKETMDTDGSDFIRKEDGTLDIDASIEKSPSFVVDMKFFAALVINDMTANVSTSSDKIYSAAEAMEYVKDITGEDVVLEDAN